MPDWSMPDDARHAVDTLRHADIVIGVPSYNNARTIGHVVRAIHAGLAKYFPKFSAVIVNSDGGSSDGTRDAVLTTSVDLSRLLIVSTPLRASTTFPYRGIPGEGSAFRMIFQDGGPARSAGVRRRGLRSTFHHSRVDRFARPAGAARRI